MGLRNLARRWVVIWAIVCTLFFVFAVESLQQISDEAPKADAAHYVTMGYNLSEYGVISLDNSDSPNPAPTAYREPGFPAYIALVRTLHPKLRQANLSSLLSSGEEVKILRYSLFLLVFVTAFITAYFVYDITHNKILACIALFLVSFSHSLLHTANKLYAENLAALLVLCVSVALYQTCTQKKRINFAFLGILLGLLVLVRAIFIYFLVFAAAFLIFAYIKKVFSKSFFSSFAIFLVCYSLITGAWIFRNYVYFNDFFITGRSGVVLLIRAEHNTMDVKEYFGSFFVWTPGETSENFIDKFFGKNALEQGGDLERLNRRSDRSFYRSARAERARLVEFFGSGIENATVNNKLESTAKKRILSHPFKHILVTLPIIWHGLFVESGFYFFEPDRPSVIISLIYFISLGFIIVVSLLKQKWSLFAFMLPSLFLYSMHSFLTHNVPRFNEPLIPILVISFLYSVYLLINRKRIKYL